MSINSLAPFRKTFKNGEVLLREGEKDTQIVILEKGIFEVFIKGKKINTVDAGVSQELIGEVGAILEEPRTATVIAASDAVAVFLPKFELEKGIKNMPGFGVKMIKSLCKRLSSTSSAFSDDQNNKSSISGSEDNDIINYMKGLLYLIEEAAFDKKDGSAKKLLEYFLKTNPWKLAIGEKEKVYKII
ncbi:MAG: cyclic nucleotide-binding domain-containing protein [Desulfobacterales bacterium]|nr:cyclic nucleotide-binding domain-containing protein [Desulfobacterales bacterium]MBF0395545.1 cyclic nucleotide-binding domain-containing protein [Desulfobacterales bacterium]